MSNFCKNDEVVLTSIPISKDLAYELKAINKGEKIPIVSDVMFQTMLNNESRKQYVSYLISLVLNKPYNEIFNSIKFLKNKIDKSNFYKTNKTVDLVCKIDDEFVNIEMNNNITPGVLERNIAYALSLYNNMKMGDKYKYNHIIQININNFSYKNIDDVVQKYTLSSEDKKYVLTDKLTFLQIYLPKVRKKYYNGDNLSELEKLLLVFNEKDNLKEITKGNKIMEEYIKDASESSHDEEVMGLYDKELHLKMIHNNELDYAKEQGMEQGKIETAKRLLENNVDINIIIDSTGLSKEQIETFIK